MMAWIVPRFSKEDLRNNRLCFYMLLRATVVSLLVTASIGSYFIGSRYLNQHSSYDDFNVIYATNSPISGNHSRTLDNILVKI